MLRKITLASCFLLFCVVSTYAQNPDSVIIPGDLRIAGEGNGLVFFDGSVQYKAAEQGPPGPANTLSIGEVTTGASGSQAAANITGTAPNQSLHLTIPQGPPPQITLATICAAISALNAQLPSFCAVSYTRGFTQNDLTDTWNFSGLQIGVDPEGWQIGNVSIDSFGGITFNSVLNQVGSTVPPAAPGVFQFITDSNGIVSLNNSPLFQGVMSTNKNLTVSTQSYGPNETGSQLLIFQKQIPGVTFNSSDLVGSWYFNGIQTVGPGWVSGSMTIDNSGSITFNTYLDSTNNTTPPAPPGAFQYSINSNGIVTMAGYPSLTGIVSSTKDMLIQTQTLGGGTGAQLLILQKRNPGISFSNTDLSGTSYFTGIQTVGPGWVRGTATVDSSGSATFTSCLDSAGHTTPPAPAGVLKYDITSDGILKSANSTSLTGIMSANKNIVVQTQTIGTTGAQLIIYLK
jgi:hypothetical protein